MRRFAFLLTGSRAEADAIVEDALRRAGEVAAGEAGRLEMLGRVVDSFRAGDGQVGAGVTQVRPVDDRDGDLMRAVRDLPPDERVALLLVVTMGVEPADGAVLLDTTEDEVRRRLSRARGQLLPPRPPIDHRRVRHERAASGL